jgi:hypothetical protein
MYGLSKACYNWFKSHMCIDSMTCHGINASTHSSTTIMRPTAIEISITKTTLQILMNVFEKVQISCHDSKSNLHNETHSSSTKLWILYKWYHRQH